MNLLTNRAGLSLLGACLFSLIHGDLLAETEPGSKKITRTISHFPTRIEQVFIRASWGLEDAARFECNLINKSGETWKDIKADGGCTCLQIKFQELPKAGIAPGEMATLSVAYEKPKEPQIVQRTIRILADGARAEMPVVVAWKAPLLLEKIEQHGEDAWVASGRLSDQFALASIDSLNKDVEVLAWDASSGKFTIRLRAKVRTMQHCSLRCIVKPVADDADKSVEQMLEFSLESSAPRSIPSRLICTLDASGKLSGSTRIVFPRVRRTARPDLVRCELTTPTGTVIPMKTTVDKLGSIAMKVDFASTLPLPATVTQADSEVRFLFNDGSKVSCHIQIEKESDE